MGEERQVSEDWLARLPEEIGGLRGRLYIVERMVETLGRRVERQRRRVTPLDVDDVYDEMCRFRDRGFLGRMRWVLFGR